VVSTEDAEIADVARSYGAAVPFMRPVSLAQDDSSKWDVFRHVVQELERVEGGRIDVLADLDTGVPLRLPSDIDAAVELLDAADAEVVVTAYRSSRNPYFNMVEVGLDGFARVMKPLSSPVKNRQEAPQVYSLSPAVYAIRRDTLFKVDHWSRARMRLLEIDRRRAIDIDDNIDFEVVEYFLKNRSATP
jgi:N-acylneuraminate cytidylyltransferase/CMP-N,N'-diacetyllegionaminic acid synthase